MADGKKKSKVKATDVTVGSRTLEAVLIDLAEQTKANDARCAERVARAEDLATIALQTIAAVSQDLRAVTQDVRALTQEVRAVTHDVRTLTQDVQVLTQELRVFAGRTDARLGALEKPTAAE